MDRKITDYNGSDFPYYYGSETYFAVTDSSLHNYNYQPEPEMGDWEFMKWCLQDREEHIITRILDVVQFIFLKMIGWIENAIVGKRKD